MPLVAVMRMSPLTHSSIDRQPCDLMAKRTSACHHASLPASHASAKHAQLCPSHIQHIGHGSCRQKSRRGMIHMIHMGMSHMCMSHMMRLLISFPECCAVELHIPGALPAPALPLCRILCIHSLTGVSLRNIHFPNGFSTFSRGPPVALRR